MISLIKYIIVAEYNTGDEVFCKVYGLQLVAASSKSYDHKYGFKILNYDSAAGYLIYVPFNIVLSDCIYINKHNYNFYLLESKYIDSYVKFIQYYHIVSTKTKQDGLFCERCNLFCEMAEPTDNKFTCWHCRKYPFYK